MRPLRGRCAAPQGGRIHPHDIVAAALSRDIYLDPVAFERAAVRDGLQPVGWYDHRGTQAALACRSDAAWLVFRGTEAASLRLLDLVANVKLAPRPWSGEGWVHGGYADALERVRDHARRMAERVSAEIPLYVTGHSLGGAVATLYAAWVTADRVYGHRIAGLVTFGAPRAGSPAALRPIAEHSRVRRYVMPADPAPWWPWPLYRHPGRAISLEPTSWWPGPLARHSVAGYAASFGGRCAGSSG